MPKNLYAAVSYECREDQHCEQWNSWKEYKYCPPHFSDGCIPVQSSQLALGELDKRSIWYHLTQKSCAGEQFKQMPVAKKRCNGGAFTGNCLNGVFNDMIPFTILYRVSNVDVYKR